MPANGPYLIALTVAAIGLLLFMILAVRLHAFLALSVRAKVQTHLLHLRFVQFTPAIFLDLLCVPVNFITDTLIHERYG